MLIFQSTCPARGTTRRCIKLRHLRILFQSTCPARGTTTLESRIAAATEISIHVPREGHDEYLSTVFLYNFISIHVPREGHDLQQKCALVLSPLFQSTCPARGTTRLLLFFAHKRSYFNPRAPRGARRLIPALHMSFSRHFNPRAPRGARHEPLRGQHRLDEFQSTCPARGTTFAMMQPPNSPHAFQSTCPARGTTANMHNFFVQICARVTNIPLKGMPYLQKTYVSI